MVSFSLHSEDNNFNRNCGNFTDRNRFAVCPGLCIHDFECDCANIIGLSEHLCGRFFGEFDFDDSVKPGWNSW